MVQRGLAIRQKDQSGFQCSLPACHCFCSDIDSLSGHSVSRDRYHLRDIADLDRDNQHAFVEKASVHVAEEVLHTASHRNDLGHRLWDHLRYHQRLRRRILLWTQHQLSLLLFGNACSSFKRRLEEQEAREIQVLWERRLPCIKIQSPLKTKLSPA